MTVDDSPDIGVTHELTSPEVRDTIEFSRVYLAFADQLEELVRNVRATVAERRWNVGQRALGVYGTVKSANRPTRKLAVANAAALRRALGRKGGRRKTPGAAAPDAPQRTT